MQSDIKYLKKSQAMMTLAILFGVVSFGLAIVKNIVTERWALQRDNVACIPADVDHSHPIVYRQSTILPTQQDALLKTFVETYVHLTHDEQIVDYHAVSSNERYKDAKLSKSKWAAIEMSSGVEKALNMKKYEKSNELFYDLKRGNMGWVFLIDDIIIHGIPESGTVLAVVRGEFQVTYDKVKIDLPHKLWGYREITLLLNQGIPTTKVKNGDYDNKYGWFVTWSSTQVLTPDQKDKLSERSHDYYLMKEIK